jgi:hypothetical protein
MLEEEGSDDDTNEEESLQEEDSEEQGEDVMSSGRETDSEETGEEDMHEHEEEEPPVDRYVEGMRIRISGDNETRALIIQQIEEWLEDLKRFIKHIREFCLHCDAPIRHKPVSLEYLSYAKDCWYLDGLGEWVEWKWVGGEPQEHGAPFYEESQVVGGATAVGLNTCGWCGTERVVDGDEQ